MTLAEINSIVAEAERANAIAFECALEGNNHDRKFYERVRESALGAIEFKVEIEESFEAGQRAIAHIAHLCARN